MNIIKTINKGIEEGKTDFLWTEKEILSLLTYMNANAHSIKFMGANHWIDEKMYEAVELNKK